MTNTAYILEDAGFTRQQVDALTVHWEGSVATKTDIAELRGELKTDIAELRTELKYIKWIGAAILVGIFIPIIKTLL